MLLFKVLTGEGRPANQSARATGFVYPLPNGEPTDWTPSVAGVEACKRGYHLTTRPSRYWVAGGRLFTAEARGAMDFHGGDKVAFESIRLLEEVTPEWRWLPLFPECRALLYSTWRLNHADDERPAWADLSRADLSEANLYRADLSRANLSEANLYRADLSRADLSRADLSRADLYRANLSRADLSRANLSGANLSEANLSEANLSRANLSEANLYRADLSRADLSRADLYRANLSRANLSRADLSRANLSGANLSGADLSEADFSEANLYRANLSTLPDDWELDEYGRARRKSAESS